MLPALEDYLNGNWAQDWHPRNGKSFAQELPPVVGKEGLGSGYLVTSCAPFHLVSLLALVVFDHAPKIGCL